MLSVEYEVADDLPSGLFVEVRERRGSVTIRLDGNATVQQLAQALNPAIAALLRGGCWAQRWKGEIITADSPAQLKGDWDHAGIHRGPLVQEGSSGPW